MKAEAAVMGAAAQARAQKNHAPETNLRSLLTIYATLAAHKE